MAKSILEIANSEKIRGWHLLDSEHDDFTIGLVLASRVEGKNCAFIESLSSDSDCDQAKILLQVI